MDQRTNREQLEKTCLDCCDFLKHPCVECDDCPVLRLKLRAEKIFNQGIN